MQHNAAEPEFDWDWNLRKAREHSIIGEERKRGDNGKAYEIINRVKIYRRPAKSGLECDDAF